jgi:hypothetical protein
VAAVEGLPHVTGQGDHFVTKQKLEKQKAERDYRTTGPQDHRITGPRKTLKAAVLKAEID